MSYRVTLIPGDGVGPEITDATRRVLEATGVSFQWDTAQIGASALESEGTPLPDAVLDSIKKNSLALKGPVTTPVGTGFRSVNVALRKLFDLYACVRPCKSYVGVKSKYSDIDLVVIRENTEDLYAGIEFEKGSKNAKEIISLITKFAKKTVRGDSALSIKPISLNASRRIVKYAFDYAVKNKRRKVTAVHKANIMKYTEGYK